MGSLSSKEVLDLDLLLVLGDNGTDWEMCMYQSHFVAEALGGANHHVVDERFESGDGTSLFVSTVPHLNSHIKAVHLLGGHLHDSDVDSDVTQVFRDLTSWASYCNFSCFDGNSDYKLVNDCKDKLSIHSIIDNLPPSMILT